MYHGEGQASQRTGNAVGNSPSLSSRAPSQGLLSQRPLCVKWGKNFQVMRIHWQNFQELKRIFSFLSTSDEMVFATLAGQIGKKGPFQLPCHLAGGKEPDVETIRLMVSPLLLTHSLLAALSLFGEREGHSPLSSLSSFDKSSWALMGSSPRCTYALALLTSPNSPEPITCDVNTLSSNKSASYVAKIAHRNRTGRAEANKWSKSNH